MPFLPPNQQRQSTEDQPLEFFKIQDYGGHHIGKSKNCYTSATAGLIIMKFGMMTQNGSLNRPDL